MFVKTRFLCSPPRASLPGLDPEEARVSRPDSEPRAEPEDYLPQSFSALPSSEFLPAAGWLPEPDCAQSPQPFEQAGQPFEPLAAEGVA